MVESTGALSRSAHSVQIASQTRFRPPKQIEEKLDSALQGAGLDDQQISAFKQDLEAALESAMKDGSISGPQDLMKTVQSVFAEHGLNVNDFADRLQPPGGFAGLGTGGTQDSATEQLLKLLESTWKEADASQDRSERAANLSQRVSNSLAGLDRTA